MRPELFPTGFAVRAALMALPFLPPLLWPSWWQNFSFGLMVAISYFAFWAPFGGSAVMAACAISKRLREPRVWWTIVGFVAMATFTIGLGWHLGSEIRFRQPLPFSHALYFGFQMAMFPLASAAAARGMLRVFDSRVLAAEYALVAAALMIYVTGYTRLPPGFQGIFP
jgi:hypothetical protein